MISELVDGSAAMIAPPACTVTGCVDDCCDVVPVVLPPSACVPSCAPAPVPVPAASPPAARPEAPPSFQLEVVRPPDCPSPPALSTPRRVCASFTASALRRYTT